MSQNPTHTITEFELSLITGGKVTKAKANCMLSVPQIWLGEGQATTTTIIIIVITATVRSGQFENCCENKTMCPTQGNICTFLERGITGAAMRAASQQK